MHRRGSVNINELINRFEDDAPANNVKYVKITRPKGTFYEDDLDDENRLIKYSRRKRSNATMSSAKEMTKQTIASILSRISGFLEMVSKFPFPRMSVMSFGLISLVAVFISPRSFTERALYPGFRLIFSIIYPAYRSFKAVRNKNLKEYLRWIVYWIVYAFLTCIELVTDALFSWFPFFFELKVVTLIWLLGPSSRGAMKVYKSCIHPTLISREQEIDDIIQIAQDRGYMHVFRLGSKSVNYANKIIMQETKTTPDNNFVVQHQLMKNISLSNLSDADTTHSNDGVDDDLRLRKFSTESLSLSAFGIRDLSGNQFNYSPFEKHRKPSLDLRYEDISSGYSSPESYFRHQPAYIEEREDDREMYYRNLSRNRAYSMQSESEEKAKNFDGDFPRRKASINELSEEDILLAYNRIMKERNPSTEVRNEDLSGEVHAEFLRWMEMKRKDGNPNALVTSSEKSEKKVNIEETSNDAVNVVEEVEAAAAESNDFEDFKDVISEDSDEYLNVPLVLLEGDETQSSKIDELPTVIESNVTCGDEIEPLNDAADENTVEAKITLSDAKLTVVTTLSSSNISLASDDGSKKQRPAKHSKGRAPPPPNVPGHFYDHVTKKHFKETEL